MNDRVITLAFNNTVFSGPQREMFMVRQIKRKTADVRRLHQKNKITPFGIISNCD